MSLDALCQKNIWRLLAPVLIDFWKVFEYVCKLWYKIAHSMSIFKKLLVILEILFVIDSFCGMLKAQWLSNLNSPSNFLSNEGSHAILWIHSNILKIFRVHSLTRGKRVRVGTLVLGPNLIFLIDLWFLSPMATLCNPSKLFDEISILTSPPISTHNYVFPK